MLIRMSETEPRRVTCERCGTAFDCGLGATCWCVAETSRLPLPKSGDCLCRECLQKAAAQAEKAR